MLPKSFLPSYADAITAKTLSVLSACAALLLVLIISFLVVQSWPSLREGAWLKFFTNEGWHPLENKLGLLPMLWATLAAGIGALLLALPLGAATAIFSLYIAPARIGQAINLIINLLAGIPSVIYGLWGLTLLVPLINQWQAPGTSLLAAIIVLALMILPTIAITTRSALAALPSSYHQAAACMALSRMTLITRILLPAASRGISSGVLLALARAFGETMAVLMVAGNVVQTPHSLFDPVRVLTANIALEMAYATDLHRSALFASCLILMLLVASTLLFAITIQRKSYAPQ
jgi:phosphate transport system permease protein